MIFQVIRISIAKKPYIFLIFQGQSRPPAPSGSAYVTGLYCVAILFFVSVFTGKDHEDLQNIKEAEEERLRQEYVKEQEQARLERQQARLLKLSENNQSGKQDDQEPIKLSENNQSGLQDDHAPIKLNENNALKPVC